jgi:putative FmdB family regulatory protein
VDRRSRLSRTASRAWASASGIFTLGAYDQRFRRGAAAPTYDRRVPLYAFMCSACGEGFEALQRLDAEPPRCPACGTPETRRTLSTFVAGPARRRESTWTPAATRRDVIRHHHH